MLRAYRYVLYCFFQLVTHRLLFEDDSSDGAGEEELLSLTGALAWLGLVTVAIAFISENLTGALEGAAASWGLSDTFVGFVILPIVGNAAEHSTAVLMAHKVCRSRFVENDRRTCTLLMSA